MAQPGYGVSFLPGGDQSYTRPGAAGSSPVQEAIKVLSLRVPRVVGSTPLAPLALLSGQGGGGLPSGVVDTLLRALTPPTNAQPPVAAVPSSPTLQAPAATPAAPVVPQAVAPTSPGVAPAAGLTAPVTPAPSTPLSSLLRTAPTQPAQPSLSARPAVMPAVSGAPSGAPAIGGAAEPAMTSIPMPRVTPMTEPAGTLPGTPTTTAPTGGEPAGGTGQGGENEALWEVARKIRQALMV